MINIIIGVAVLFVGGAGLWYVMPHKGHAHWHTEVPILDSVIPVMIVAAFGVAVAMIVAGVAGMAT